VTGDPAPCNGCSTFETKPSLAPDGRTFTAESFLSVAQVGSFARLLVRPRAAAASTRRSSAWSPDGSRLVAVDRPGDQTTEVWTFNADGSDQRLVLTAPAGVAIRTVTYMGAGRLLFDVNFDNGTDLWSVPASCSACAFPAGMTRVTNNGTSRDPAWTPAARIGGSPLTSVRAVRVGRGLALRLRLTEAARVRIVVGRAGDGHAAAARGDADGEDHAGSGAGAAAGAVPPDGSRGGRAGSEAHGPRPLNLRSGELRRRTSNCGWVGWW
jgi:hypothetical protein